jgi:hypothetical protein
VRRCVDADDDDSIDRAWRWNSRAIDAWRRWNASAFAIERVVFCGAVACRARAGTARRARDREFARARDTRRSSRVVVVATAPPRHRAREGVRDDDDDDVVRR